MLKMHLRYYSIIQTSKPISIFDIFEEISLETRNTLVEINHEFKGQECKCEREKEAEYGL